MAAGTGSVQQTGTGTASVQQTGTASAQQTSSGVPNGGQLVGGHRADSPQLLCGMGPQVRAASQKRSTQKVYHSIFHRPFPPFLRPPFAVQTVSGSFALSIEIISFFPLSPPFGV